MANQQSEKGASVEEILAEIRRQLEHLQYGSLEIQIHNGRVVQLERREKKRFGKTEFSK